MPSNRCHSNTLNNIKTLERQCIPLCQAIAEIPLKTAEINQIFELGVIITIKRD